jgi:cytochrome c-type biogenesis protein CcmH/NrfG
MALQTSASQSPQPDSNAQANLAQAAAPLLEAIRNNPNDYDSLVKLGNLFYDGQQYSRALTYYERALTIHPENPDVRTDLGTAYWYTGKADQAIAEMETSLKYRPGHPQALFNLGWMRWQGKADPQGAVTAWEKLLEMNPGYPQRQLVEQYIAKAKEHAAHS